MLDENELLAFRPHIVKQDFVEVIAEARNPAVWNAGVPRLHIAERQTFIPQHDFQTCRDSFTGNIQGGPFPRLKGILHEGGQNQFKALGYLVLSPVVEADQPGHLRGISGGDTREA
jgi:hypothetical protein